MDPGFPRPGTLAGADPGFPVGGGTSPAGGAIGTYDFAKIFQKKHMKLRTFWAVGRGAPIRSASV